VTIELSLQDVRTGYGAVEVLHGVSLDVPTGSLTALLGPNGAGKTTLMSAVAGLLPLRSGQILWSGRDVVGTPPDDLARAGMMLIPERRGIFATLSVRDNLAVFAGQRGDVSVALEAFPVLGQRLTQLAGSLSGGEQQMLAMSRALLGHPRLLLLDEISLGLAPLVVGQLYEALPVIRAQGTTVLVVEQDVSQALRSADRVLCLLEGRAVLSGTPAELTPERIERAYFGLTRSAS